MRAWAAFRAPGLNKEERNSQARKKRRACKDKEVQKQNEQDLPSEALATFSYSTHSLPKSTNLFIRLCPENKM
jgi:hypothetical protein